MSNYARITSAPTAPFPRFVSTANKPCMHEQKVRHLYANWEASCWLVPRASPRWDRAQQSEALIEFVNVFGEDWARDIAHTHPDTHTRFRRRGVTDPKLS